MGGPNIIRYLVLAWDAYYPGVGIDQIKFRFSSEGDAVKRAKELVDKSGYDYSCVYDVEEDREVVKFSNGL